MNEYCFQSEANCIASSGHGAAFVSLLLVIYDLLNYSESLMLRNCDGKQSRTNWTTYNLFFYLYFFFLYFLFESSAFSVVDDTKSLILMNLTVGKKIL